MDMCMWTKHAIQKTYAPRVQGSYAPFKWRVSCRVQQTSPDHRFRAPRILNTLFSRWLHHGPAQSLIPWTISGRLFCHSDRRMTMLLT